MKRYRVHPGDGVDLAKWDPNDRSAFDGNKDEGKMALTLLNQKLADLQNVLYAQSRHKVLLIFQAMDTGGKDGTIRRVFRGVNPQGIKVAAFKQPTPEELAHDYLWRVHQHTPANGEISIFNRSHYEDVLVIRVHQLIPKSVWQRRYDHINAFEQLLADEGTLILKFFLHIDLDEQKERLQARLDDPKKRWKFAKGDLDERKLWPEYMRAYSDVLSKTSTKAAPWYVIPANRKWYRNLVVAQIIIDALEGLQMSYPPAEEGLDGIVVE